MRRRRVLGTLGGLGLAATAGCADRLDAVEGFDFGQSTPRDSDDVPDSRDVEPLDPSLRVPADVRETPTTTEAAARGTSTQSSSAPRRPSGTGAPDQVRTIQADNAGAAGVTHHLRSYSREHVELHLDGRHLDHSYPDGAEVLVLVQGYPGTARTGEVLESYRGDVLADVEAGTTDATVRFDDRVTPADFFHYTCLLVPAGESLSAVSRATVDTLCDTDRLVVRDGELRRVRHPDEPEPLSTERYARTPVEGQYHLEFSGSTLGTDWEAAVTVFKRVYVADKGRPAHADFREYVYESIRSGLADDFAAIMADQAEAVGLTSPREQVEYLIDFVQHLPYVPDDVGTGYDDYTKRPVESLVEGGGDCEDSSIMLASLLSADAFGYGTALFLLPGHVAVGVRGEEGIDGTYYETEGVRYYYVETTGRGWAVGQVPDRYRDEGARLLRVGGSP